LAKDQLFFSITYVIDTIQVSELPQYQKKSVLNEKYVVGNLSVKQIAL